MGNLFFLKHPKPLNLLQKHPCTRRRQDQNKRNPKDHSVQVVVVVGVCVG